MSIETQLILERQVLAVVVAVACALPGVFLVLRRLALMSDAISHAMLLGIVLAFLLVRDIHSPLLLLAAAATGVATVTAVELLQRTRRVREDTAIGLVFPLLFAGGVLLASRYARNQHLDQDAVLAGDLALSVLDRLVIHGYDLGPKGLYSLLFALVLNVAFIGIFYKELKLATFDAGLAAALGFAPGLLHYGLMTIVSVTAVAAYDVVGTALVVALMIAPPAAAYLLTDRLARLLGCSALLGVVVAVGGYWLSRWIRDVNIGSCLATFAGLVFGLVYLFAPGRGLVALARRRRQQRWQFAQRMLVMHLLHHEGQPEADQECRVDHLQAHLRWPRRFAAAVLRRAEQAGLVTTRQALLELTPRGRELAREAFLEP